jgi:hypothetical protein
MNNNQNISMILDETKTMATDKSVQDFFGHVKLELHYKDGVITSYALEARESRLLTK